MERKRVRNVKDDALIMDGNFRLPKYVCRALRASKKLKESGLGEVDYVVSVIARDLGIDLSEETTKGKFCKSVKARKASRLCIWCGEPAATKIVKHGKDAGKLVHLVYCPSHRAAMLETNRKRREAERAARP